MPVDQNLQESSREDKTNDSVTLEPIRHIQKRGRGIVRSPFPRWPSVVVFREIMLGFTPTVGIEPRRFAPFGGAPAVFPEITSRRLVPAAGGAAADQDSVVASGPVPYLARRASRAASFRRFLTITMALCMRHIGSSTTTERRSEANVTPE